MFAIFDNLHRFLLNFLNATALLLCVVANIIGQTIIYIRTPVSARVQSCEHIATYITGTSFTLLRCVWWLGRHSSIVCSSTNNTNRPTHFTPRAISSSAHHQCKQNTKTLSFAPAFALGDCSFCVDPFKMQTFALTSKIDRKSVVSANILPIARDSSFCRIDKYFVFL